MKPTAPCLSSKAMAPWLHSTSQVQQQFMIHLYQFHLYFYMNFQEHNLMASSAISSSPESPFSDLLQDRGTTAERQTGHKSRGS